MWHVFKFFFIWFWLGFATFLLGAFLVGSAHPLPARGIARQRALAHTDSRVLWIPIASFFMSVPAYFLARPKEETASSGGFDSSLPQGPF